MTWLLPQAFPEAPADPQTLAHDPAFRLQAFPERRLPDGRPVCSYEELIEYLVARDPAICVAELPFEGRNRVVYCTAWT